MLIIDVPLLNKISDFDFNGYWKSKNSFCLVAEIHDVILGYAACDKDGEYVEIRDITVAEPVRRQGVGTAIVGSISSIYGTEASIEASIPWWNTDAQYFFSANGFGVVNKTTRDNEEAYLFRKGKRFRKAPDNSYRFSQQDK